MEHDTKVNSSLLDMQPNLVALIEAWVALKCLDWSLGAPLQRRISKHDTYQVHGLVLGMPIKLATLVK